MESNIYRMLTVDEAVDLLGISERSIRNLIVEGALPSWRPGPGTVRIPYWVVIWQVSKQNGMPLEELTSQVLEPVQPKPDVASVVSMLRGN